MAADASELLALALSFEAEVVTDLEAVELLVESSGYRTTHLMAACSYAVAMARDLPFDPSTPRTLRLLSRAVQRAAVLSGEQPSPERATLLEQIVEISGHGAMAPGAVESRSVELEEALARLRSTADGDRTPTTES